MVTPRKEEVRNYIKKYSIPNDCTHYYLSDGIYKCISSSSSCTTISPNYKFYKGKECLEQCYGYKPNYNSATSTETECFTELNDCVSGTHNYKYYDTILKICWSTLPTNYYIKSNNDGKYEVVTDCGSNLLKYDGGGENRKCITFEDCKNLGLIKIGGLCQANSDSNCVSSKFIYNSECIDSCGIGTGHDYHNKGSKECIPNCSGDYPYHKENGYECYKSCKNDDTGLSGYIYLKDTICSNVQCSSYSQTIKEGSEVSFYKCYERQEDCIRAGLKYLKGSNECVSECDTSNFKAKPMTNSNEEIISLGKCFTDLNECKADGYYFYNTQLKECWYSACKSGYYTMEIDTNGHPVENNGDTCVTSCPNGYSLKDNYCKKICGGTGEEFFDEDSSKCVGSCNTNKYYYEDEKICRSESCTLFKSGTSNNICVTECQADEQVSGNKCINQCLDNKFFVEEKIEIKGVLRTIQKCIDTSCLEYSNEYGIIYYYQGGKKECLKTCHEGFYKIGTSCYKNCDGADTFFNPANFACGTGSSICTSDFYEKLSNNPDINICRSTTCEPGKFKLKDTNNKYECLSECPSGSNYIDNNNECVSNSVKCSPGKLEVIKEVKDSYIIYECIPSCPNDYYYSNAKKKCFSICKGNDNDNPYSLTKTPNGERICSGSCNDGTYKFYKDDKVCISQCNELIEDDTNRCIENCDNENYKFKYEDEETNKHECKNACPSGKQYYLKSNYECLDICPPPTIYLSEEGNECIEKCDEHQYKDPLTNGLYKCVRDYGDKYYYISNRILIVNCGSDYVVEDTHECIQNCDLLTNNKYYYYEPETVDATHVKKCVLSCATTDQTYYEDNHCKSLCSSNRFYKPNEKICMDSCPTGYKTDGSICVNSCRTQTTNIFLDNEKCVDHCPNGDNRYKFYIDQENQCIPDCNSGKRFYTEIGFENGGTTLKEYKCHDACNNYKLLDEEISAYAKQCLPTDKTCSTESVFSDENDQFLCYRKCPSDKYIYEEGTTKKCLSQCPKYKYHIKGSKVCIDPSQCPDKTADFISKECVSKCETTYYSEIKEDGTLKATICLNACNDDEYGHYVTPNNKCVKNCGVDDDEFTAHSTDNKCVCPKKYYFTNDPKRIVKCINSNNCYDDSNVTGFKIDLFGTSQCLTSCNYIPSLNGNICYKTENEACTSPLDYNSVLKVVGNGKKCECPFKFYIDEHGTKHCLNEFAECLPTYKYYIPETMECVSSCQSTTDFKKEFKTFCLRTCPSCPTKPSVSTESDNKCSCGSDDRNLWYSTGGSSFVCLDDNALCPDNYPLLAPQTNQCLEKCKGSYYPYLYDENQCYSGCRHIPNTDFIVINSNLAVRSCVCQKPWYFSFPEGVKKMNCPAESDNNNCFDYKNPSNENFNKLFMIHDTNECVENCPSIYPYFFNHECFTDCERHAEPTYHYIAKKGSYECQCKFLWYYKDDDRKIKECFDENKKLCIDSIPAKPYLVYDTNECVKECPPESKVFNMTCYNKCPEFTLDSDTDTETGYSCSCNKDIDAYWYKFKKNYNLPDSTGVVSSKTITYYGCGVLECPYFLPYLLKEEKKCLLSCIGSSFEYSLRHICYENCPEFTESDDDTVKICKFMDLDNEEEVNDKESLKNYANVQAKELYESRFTYNDGNHIGGYLFNKFEDVSLQIYAIDKYDTLKEYSTKSNLTYIDLDTCLPKIFMDNSIRETDKIIVAKYDLTYWNVDTENSGSSADSSENKDKEKHIINKVEYELYNSRTMDRIDASVCDPYEILISYPIVFNKNRYNNYESGFNDNEYKKKFDIGKKLHLKDNELDTFNSNDTLYKDLCLGIEIDGKDLVLEDRYQFLYPNGAVLCESNCTFNSTDFDEERINCKCSYKEDIDFKRVENEKNDLLNDPNFKLPEQSGSNLDVIKCLGKLSFKKSIKKNEAFYYCAAVTVVVISMTLVTAFYGLKAVSSNIKGMYNKFGNKNGENINNFEDTKINNKNEINKNDNNLSTSHRILSAPPKKNMNNNNEDEDRNIIDNKDIGMIYNINQSKNEDENIENINNENIIDDSFKAEYLPPQYNFKFFKLNDKGIRKQIERAKLPFKVNPDVKYLLERKKGTTYPENYLKGPFYSNQNIIEIIDKNNDEQNVNNNNNFGNSKEVKYIRNNNNDNNSQIKLINDKESPQKRNLKNNLNFNMNMKNENKKEKEKEKEKKELDFISIKKITFNKKNNNEGQDNEEEISEKKDENVGLYTLIKREQALLRVSYNKYVMKDHSNILSVFLAEILDKVYLVKICLFLKKFEIFGVHFSLYLFCHLLLLTLSCAFFTISTIKKIWNEDKYPGMSYYLLYGIITNIVVWVVYRVFLCLLDIQDNVKELMKNDNKDKSENIDENKFNEIMKKLKCRIIIFYCIIYVFIIIFALYLISFFAIYTGTKSSVLEAYIIGIIEILLIKLVYGICLASLRIASEGNELKSLYKLVYLLDKYVS